jgi:hypothetical protein
VIVSPSLLRSERGQLDPPLSARAGDAGGERFRAALTGLAEPALRRDLVDESSSHAARFPFTPSATVQNMSARSRRTFRLSTSRVSRAVSRGARQQREPREG